MRSIRIAAALAALAALTTACGGGDSSGGDDQITLGAWYPLSGPQASSGTPQEVGARVYFEQLNDAGGIDGQQVEFITKDNAFDPQQTLQIARDLVSRDQVDAIVATNGTATTEATFPFVLQQNKVPIFGTYGGSAAWYDPPQDGLFGTQALYEDQAKSAVEWAIEDGVQDLLVVRDDPDAFADVSTVAMEDATALGAQADEVVVKIGTTDYAPIVNQVKSEAPDGVLLILPPQEAAAYLNEAALQGIDIQSYGYSPAATESTIELAGENAEGFKAVSLTLPVTADDPAVEEFRDAMEEYAPDAEPDLYSLSAYSAAKAFGEILKTIDGEVTKESITEAIGAASDIETGVAPPFSFSEDDHLGTDAVVRVQVTDGRYVAQGNFQAPQQ